MTIYQVLCLFSVPALLAAIFKHFYSQMRETQNGLTAIKAGLQALLRAQLIADYNKWSEKDMRPSTRGRILKTAGGSITRLEQTA